MPLHFDFRVVSTVQHNFIDDTKMEKEVNKFMVEYDEEFREMKNSPKRI